MKDKDDKNGARRYTADGYMSRTPMTHHFMFRGFFMR